MLTSLIREKNDPMTDCAEGSSACHPLASLQLDVAVDRSTERQPPENQTEVPTLFITTNEDGIEKIIAGVWHGKDCTSTCCTDVCAYKEWRLSGDKLLLYCFKNYDDMLATRPAIFNLDLCFRFNTKQTCVKHPQLENANCFIFFEIIAGDIHKNWMQVLRRLTELSSNSTPKQLRRWSRSVDEHGNTALIVGAKRLMNCGLFKRTFQFVSMMLAYGSDVNWLNNSGRSLITYTVHYMDQALDITKLLLNSGATIWLEDCNSEKRLNYVKVLKEYRNSSDSRMRFVSEDPIESPLDSIFTWFLRSVMIRRRLDDGCLCTLDLLSQTMGDDPSRMHTHVMRTMFSHAQCYNIFGPVFFQIKKALSPQWVQPRSLQQLCRKTIRYSLFNGCLKNAHPESVAKLKLPTTLESYVCYNT
ncbi:SOCS box domain,Ankyrin repeat-containing domain [Cinara cedri]|uniref:SOCS box domain,Ankyrin repeat-containing domain n=1 Tax=Cinara cedri TaxID=506608 RepID=A0A5E4N893_9HEMI|nr:SOCS box domain,Ankyrin repeat-containing domain [Cinara cedri]